MESGVRFTTWSFRGHTLRQACTHQKQNIHAQSVGPGLLLSQIDATPKMEMFYPQDCISSRCIRLLKPTKRCSLLHEVSLEAVSLPVKIVRIVRSCLSASFFLALQLTSDTGTLSWMKSDVGQQWDLAWNPGVQLYERGAKNVEKKIAASPTPASSSPAARFSLLPDLKQPVQLCSRSRLLRRSVRSRQHHLRFKAPGGDWRRKGRRGAWEL